MSATTMGPAFVAALPVSASTSTSAHATTPIRSRPPTASPAPARRPRPVSCPPVARTSIRTRPVRGVPANGVADVRRRLLSRAAYLGPVALHKVQSALELAHLGAPSQLSENLAVADIVAQLGMDCDTLCAALLRGVVAVCGERAAEGAAGPAVTELLRSYDDVEELVLRAEDSRFNDASYSNLRELALLAAGEEHRALSLRLVVALVNTRGLAEVFDVDQRVVLARRAMFFDAPLANQLGMWYLQSEIEEAAFRHLAPAEYASTKRALAQRLAVSGALLATAKTDVERVLGRSKSVRTSVSRTRVVGRVKGAYSVHRKMQRSGKRIDEIYDLLALRVIVAPRRGVGDADEVAACAAVADAIRAAYPVVEARAKDYLSSPKSNGYRSLHLTVLVGDARHPLEVQIRTEKMHHVAEFGSAAHWLYKDAFRPTPDALQLQLVVDGSKRFSAVPRPRIPLALADAAQADASRRGYVAQLADAIRETRVIVKSCGQLYTLTVGSTLSDLLSGLGLASLGAVAVVNGTVAPLEQVLQMNDIVRFVCAVPDAL